MTRLETWGYIHRQPSPSDRITELGTRVINNAREADRAILTKAAVDATKLPKELKTIVLLLASQTKETIPGTR